MAYDVQKQLTDYWKNLQSKQYFGTKKRKKTTSVPQSSAPDWLTYLPTTIASKVKSGAMQLAEAFEIPEAVDEIKRRMDDAFGGSASASSPPVSGGMAGYETVETPSGYASVPKGTTSLYPSVSPTATKSNTEVVTSPTTTTTASLGEALPFPKTQAQMREYQKLYKFDPASGQWFKKAAKPEADFGYYRPEVEAGKEYQELVKTKYGNYLTESEMRERYRSFNLEDRLGKWRGTEEQYRAMSQLEKDPEALNQALLQDLPETEPEEPPISPQGDGGVTTGGDINVTGSEYVQMDTDDVKKVMDDVIDSVGSTEITDIIKEVSEGEFSPEMEITEENKEAALENLRNTAGQALQTIQQNLAKAGMTFSGIRSQQELDLAADTLAAESGINRQFAGKIIQAARNEQTRRENAVKAAEQNWQRALSSAGYVWNPFTGKIEQTLQAKQFGLQQQKFQYDIAKDIMEAQQPEKPERPEIFGTAETGYYQQFFNPDTGQWEVAPTGIVKPKTTSKEDIKKAEQRERNFWSAIDRGKNELQQGEPWGNVWNRIKAQFPEIPNDYIDNGLGVSWREPGAYQEFKGTKTSQNLSKWEMESTIWQWLTTNEAMALSAEEKRQVIMGYGLDPGTFGIY